MEMSPGVGGGVSRWCGTQLCGSVNVIVDVKPFSFTGGFTGEVLDEDQHIEGTCLSRINISVVPYKGNGGFPIII